MQEHITDELSAGQSSFDDEALDAAAVRARRFLPGPRTAPELAALDAALVIPQTSVHATRARIMVGVAAVAVAVTIPDLSLGAMGSPYTRIDLGERVSNLPAAVWMPSARPTGPVYAPVMAAEQIAPEALTFSSQPRFSEFDRIMPLGFMAQGSERFDLAFAGVELPAPQPLRVPPRDALAVSARLPRQPLTAPRVASTPAIAGPAPLARLVEVPQITVSRGFRAAPVPGLRAATVSLASDPASDRSVAATNESLEAAFAGAIDVSGAVRSSIPVTQQRPREPVANPVRVPEARAVPIPVPAPAVGARAAAETQVVQKARLDARVNGVLTGGVDFRQLDGTIAIRLGSVLDILRDRFSAREFAQLSSGMSANAYVTLAELQAAGIPIRYNPAYDEVNFGIDYNDAPQAGKVQVEQIGAPTMGTDRVGIDQIPRQ